MPSITRNPHMLEMGAMWRKLRTERKMTLEEVEKESERRFGEEGRMRVAQLSRIEKGGYDRVSLDDAVRLGQLYGLTPNEVAELYGLYREQSPSDYSNNMRDLLSIYPTLPFSAQRDLDNWLDVVIAMARGKLKEMEQEVSDTVVDEEVNGAAASRSRTRRKH